MAADDLYSMLFGPDEEARQSAQAAARLIAANREGAIAGALGAHRSIPAMAAVEGSQAKQEADLMEKGLIGRAHYGAQAQEGRNALAMSLAAMKYADAEKTRQAMLQRTQLQASLKGAMKPGDAPMDDSTMEMLAHQYARTGQLPPLGMGQAAVGHRMAIFKKAAELYPGLDVASSAAGYKADSGSLTGVQKMSDAVEAFERTAGKNLDLLLGTAGKIVDSGSPLANKPLRAIDEKLLGSTDMAAYRAARQVALTEISRVVSNPNLVGQLSDQARKEVFEFNPDNATMAQTVAVAKILRRDMSNRIASLHEQRGIIKGRISAKPGDGSEQTPPASTGTVNVNWKGKVKAIPAERLQEAIDAGATRVQ